MKKAGKIQCPKCGSDAPNFETYERVEMNFCRGCKGLWFDSHELADHCETDKNIPQIDDLAKEGKPTKFKCPRCPDAALLELPYKKGVDLLVDWCPECQGVFLDAKELGKVEKLAATFDTTKTRLQRAAKWLNDNGYAVVGGGKGK